MASQNGTILVNNFLNVDIGGGTHDLIFVYTGMNGTRTGRYVSSRFACNDLWGDCMGTPRQNGFVTCVTESYKSKDQQLQYMMTNAANASDIMSFLFAKSSVYNPASIIQSNKDLYKLVFVHYMAIVYHIAKLIQKQDIGMPENISFTGLGSKYLLLMSQDTRAIAKMTKGLLQKYTQKEVPSNFRIILANNAKEVTAIGALSDPLENFRIATLEPYVYPGFDTDKKVEYQDLNKDVKNLVIAEVNSFLDTLPSFNADLASYGISFAEADIKAIKQHLSASYDYVARTATQYGENVPIQETLFFWPLKHALLLRANDVVQP